MTSSSESVVIGASQEYRGFGQFPSPPSRDSNPPGRGEVFADMHVWYAWKAGESTHTTAEARLHDCTEISGAVIAPAGSSCRAVDVMGRRIAPTGAVASPAATSTSTILSPPGAS